MLLRPWTRPRPARGGAHGGGEGGIGTELDQCVRRGGVVGEAGVAEDHAGPRGLEGRPLDLGPPGHEERVARPEGLHGGHRVARRWRVARAESVTGRLDDRLPAGAAAQVGAQRRLDVPPRRRACTAGLVERGEAHHDARRAKAALARAVGDEGGGPAVALLGREPLEGGHASAGDAADGRDARHPGQAVDPHRAAPALALWAAAVLDRAAAELLAQRVEKRDPVGDDDRVAVQREGDGCAARVGRHRAGRVVGCGAGAAQGVGRASGPGLS